MRSAVVKKRKVPSPKESKKKLRPRHSLRRGQGIRLKGQAGKSTFIRDAKARGEIIVKTKQTHPRKKTRKEERAIARLESEAMKLLSRLEFLNLQRDLSSYEKNAQEIDEVWSRLENIRWKLKVFEKAPSKVTVRKIEKVLLADVVSKERASPKFVRFQLLRGGRCEGAL